MNFDKRIDRKGTYCTQWDYVQDRFGEKNLLPFTISDTDFSVPEQVIQAVQRRVKHPIFGYTRWNHEDFKSSIERWFNKRFQLTLSQDWIMYSPSVIYSISQLIQLKSEKGEGVVIQTPAYDAFFKTIAGNQRKIIDNPLVYEEGKYLIDFEDLEYKLSIEDNKVMVLCSPHNPTGRVWTELELIKIVQLCEKYNVFLISDEIHMDIVRKGMSHQSILKFTQENVALVTSGTKTFNFPGLLFSYLLIPDETLRDQFAFSLKNKDGLSSCSTLGLEATMSAYNLCEDWVEELNLYIDENVRLVRDFLKEYLPKIKLVEAEATYLLWLDVSALKIPMEVIQDYCVKEGRIAVMNGEVYRGNGAQFLRLNIGCSKLKLQEGLQGIKKSIDAAAKKMEG